MKTYEITNLGLAEFISKIIDETSDAILLSHEEQNKKIKQISELKNSSVETISKLYVTEQEIDEYLLEENKNMLLIKNKQEYRNRIRQLIATEKKQTFTNIIPTSLPKLMIDSGEITAKVSLFPFKRREKKEEKNDKKKETPIVTINEEAISLKYPYQKYLKNTGIAVKNIDQTEKNNQLIGSITIKFKTI